MQKHYFCIPNTLTIPSHNRIMKKRILMVLMAVAAMMSVSAQRAGQTDYAPAPYLFFGIQGGAQTTFTNFDQMKLLTPTVSGSFGAFFSPVVGARIQANGMWNKGGIKPDFKYDYNYVTTNVDLLVNLVTLFGRKDYYPLNLYLLGGVGLNVAWNNSDLNASAYAPALPAIWEKNNISRNGRLGLMLDYNLSRHLSMNLEVSGNALNDSYNSKTSSQDDWQVTAQLGVAYKFGYQKATHRTETAFEESVSQPQTLYDQMMARVNERMNTWMKRIKNESKDDYLARTTEESMKERSLEYVKEISTDMAGNRINTSVKDLQYNRDAQLLGVTFTDMPSITLKVPDSDINSFQDAKDVQFINTVYQLHPGDQFEVLYTEALNPSTGKKYVYAGSMNAENEGTESYMPLKAQKTVEKPTTAAVAEAIKPTKPVMKPEMHTEFFYLIGRTVISQGEQVKFNQLVKFLKENPDAKVNVVGYADAGTGSSETNARIARQRAENVAKALQKSAIAVQRIVTDSKGDTIQPYPENDKNRVTIIVAK